MTDNMKQIKCPACGKDMNKIFLPEQGINLDVCLNCGGIYFDNREFEKFDEKNEDITPLIELFENKTFIDVKSSDTRICPVCGMKMVKNYESIKHEVEIDECYSCGGKFLDKGELEKIRAQYDTEEARALDVINNLYSIVGKDLKEIQNKHSNIKAPNSVIAKILKVKKF